MSFLSDLALSRLWAQMQETRLPAARLFAGLGTLLFIKMCRDPAADWRGLCQSPHVLVQYEAIQIALGASADPYLASIFDTPDRSWDDPKQLKRALLLIDKLDWAELRACGVGEVWEIFNEIYAAQEHAAPEWAYLTPQSLANVMVGLLQVEPGETVVDPHAGTGSLLSAAHAYRQALLYEEPATYLIRRFSSDNGVYACESVPYRLRHAQMSLYLHALPYCAFTPGHSALPAADVLLCNALLTSNTTTEAAQCQAHLALWQDAIAQLKPGGRAGLIISDSALYHPAGRRERQAILDKINIHTLVRLPDGLFHGHDMSAHVVFFNAEGATHTLWYYDLRTGLPWFDPQHAPFQAHYFNPVIEAYGDAADGSGRRKDSGSQGRFRCFERTALKDSLDLCWLREENCDFPLFKGIPNTRADKIPAPALQDVLSGLKELSILFK
jgi:type I restriction enzyme M protein